MAALTSGSWTIRPHPNSVNQTVSGKDWRQATTINGRKKYISAKLTLSSGEVPATGVTLPSYGSLGFRRNLDGWHLQTHVPNAPTATGVGILWRLNVTGNKAVPYRNRLASGNGSTLIPLATTVTIAAQTFYVIAEGW